LIKDLEIVPKQSTEKRKSKFNKAKSPTSSFLRLDKNLRIINTKNVLDKQVNNLEVATPSSYTAYSAESSEESSDIPCANCDRLRRQGLSLQFCLKH